LTALLYHYGIVPYEFAPDSTPAYERIFLAVAKIIWWINAAWVLTGFTRVFLIFERRRLRLEGLLPPSTENFERQVERVLGHL
jgi:hypothetical protein